MTLAVPTVSTAIAPVTAAIMASMAMMTAVAGERVVGRAASLPGEALTRRDKDGENADCQKQKSKRQSDWDHPSFAHSGGMTSVAPAVTAATMVVMPPGVITTANKGRFSRTSFPSRQNHAPKEKHDNTCKHQQQDCEMHQSARVHSNWAHPRWQVHNTVRVQQP